MIGYHFTSETLRDGRPLPEIGHWIEHEGPIVPCESGLHASEHPFDALQYAPGPILHLVDLEGDLVGHGSPYDKHIGRRRRTLARLDATDLLWGFARWCALSVINKWPAPDVVRRYLETGDESLRTEAWVAAERTTWHLVGGLGRAAAAARAAASGVAEGPVREPGRAAAWARCTAQTVASAAWTSVPWEVAEIRSRLRIEFRRRVDEAFRAAAFRAAATRIMSQH